MIPPTSTSSSPSRSNPKRRRLNPPDPKSPRTRSEKRAQQEQDPEIPSSGRQHTRAQSLYSHSAEPSEIEQKSTLESANLRIINYTPQNRGNHENLVQRSLQVFLDRLPDASRSAIAKDIIRLEDDNGIYRYFRNLYSGLRTRSEFSWTSSKKLWLASSLGIVRSRSKPPSVSSSPTERILTTLHQPMPRIKEFKEGLLQRDGYHWVVTGDMDCNHWESLDCPSARHYEYEHNRSGAHHPLFEALWRCFPSIRAINFNHENINSLCNDLTLTNWVHERFGAFRIAFECTDVENKYKVHTFKGIGNKYKALLPPEVRFISNDTGSKFAKSYPARLSLPGGQDPECVWNGSSI
ncbi:hypothetical protein N7447_000866 [Penicillium robsamsonii]|uniref:uncharacterized protein n=1 Tax=Penicillium robsamsonii TaxID=1792511 RepID=UPI00254931C3|nr:uncharacterized protein N7447_000866 [Penicillium robsamsonii]KAJ5834840.1 hypothetical protein N7447_000866 [Penicillium robsamsonii]